MRVWDVQLGKLCRKHLLSQHRELHAIYCILLHDYTGYGFHPETKRLEGKLPALKKHCERLAQEMQGRGYKHNILLSKAMGEINQDILLQTIEEQEEILCNKPCDCIIPEDDQSN